MAIEFRFHLEKAIAAAVILLKLPGKAMKYLGFLQMHDLADCISAL